MRAGGLGWSSASRCIKTAACGAACRLHALCGVDSTCPSHLLVPHSTPTPAQHAMPSAAELALLRETPLTCLAAALPGTAPGQLAQGALRTASPAYNTCKRGVGGHQPSVQPCCKRVQGGQCSVGRSNDSPVAPAPLPGPSLSGMVEVSLYPYPFMCVYMQSLHSLQALCLHTVVHEKRPCQRRACGKGSARPWGSWIDVVTLP